MGNWGFLNSGNRDLGFLKSGNGELEGIWGLGIQISTIPSVRRVLAPLLDDDDDVYTYVSCMSHGRPRRRRRRAEL